MREIIEGLALLAENPLACSAIRSIQIFAAVCAVVVAVQAVLQFAVTRRLRAAWPIAPRSRLRRVFSIAVCRSGLAYAPALRIASSGTGACTIGFWRPDVCIDSATVAALDDEELEAVLLHELAHAARRDTMGATVLLFGAWSAVFLVSAGSMLAPDTPHPGAATSRLLMTAMVALFIGIRFAVTVPGNFLRELTCDDIAVRASGNPLALAAALVKVTRAQRAGEDVFILHRIKRLLNYQPPRLRLALQRMAFVSLLILLVLPAFGDEALFDQSRIHDVQITMPAAEWTRLRANFQLNTNYDATLTIDGETIRDSSIRSRGSGTRNGVKPGLRVDFDRKVKTQRFRGFETLVLDNMYNDPSLLRERLAFAVFAEMGVLVPRESFARLTVNGEYWGLYAIVEPIDEVFVRTHVDGGGGNLFEYNVPPVSPDQLQAWDFALSRGDSIDNYVPEPLEPKTNEDDLDGTALLDFLRTISQEPDATFVSKVSEFIDPRYLLTHYAVEVATSELDGLTSPFGPNNFYLYQLQDSRRFLFIPWDHDFNFTNAAHPIYYGVERNVLIDRLLGDPELNEFYRETLTSIVARLVNPGWMGAEIDFMVGQIREAVLADTKRREASFDDAVNAVRAVIAGRASSAGAQLNRGRRRVVSR